ncbi:hypothetical protein C2G38_2208083 [Gigaspora rosea]|uniref:TLDc domain-containing protein n=1 Tax=Gigaspora rosea TaxID=44941 RepID=A0A397UHK9_9GLOM|nr:hypothetical protein C2G38_2208083 [Gigaspora rosea]
MEEPSSPEGHSYTADFTTLQKSALIAPKVRLFTNERSGKDGLTTETFHQLCDNIPTTVVALKAKNKNEILGGYNLLVWKADTSEWAEKTDSSIFSLQNKNKKKPIVIRVKNNERQLGMLQHYMVHGLVIIADVVKKMFMMSHSEAQMKIFDEVLQIRKND